MPPDGGHRYVAVLPAVEGGMGVNLVGLAKVYLAAAPAADICALYLVDALRALSLAVEQQPAVVVGDGGGGTLVT